jgi:hypothetical protein
MPRGLVQGCRDDLDRRLSAHLGVAASLLSLRRRGLNTPQSLVFPRALPGGGEVAERQG